ncbi:MAG TPA: tRNA (N6-isopentenyl adenosine(37)-C2)-methylthiotransferase MiaB [Candidatus Lambdaproteobacteria bacterium]|nr:tRNA (N6-isopentenyl adenosine(37)-C2)-methylthiotransferase MiaB [Deltaproteobacteria bacterium]HHZ77855.1 tRNA (N6-isopentenyl adenosine(37)-C2)-methylthiotransferase MiaB [Candidatus Lambdaproteobacteria bacterium]HIA58232.1 tRNA (N6-isopentenyl adenosine(37)-C2)-methylthiotransferase MiaB [Candidatus Lambdaproteobacteria bacterium]HIB46097.1 tRNA (N6-isopentenyl adenosine(37)-C2)-methylthiotransferase MiaB [Candidatus Lambdaproteobacteria bacterium]HIB93192.1 tRNA (N6-isopentenyl adenosi
MNENSESAETVKKVYIKTYGCQMNEYDTDKMLEVLRHENYSQTDCQDDADLIILNTCSIREKAENKVYSELGRLRHLKSANPDLKIGVGGCVAQQEGKSILNRAKNVDFVFGTDNLFELPEMLKMVGKGQKFSRTERHSRQKVRNFIPDYTFRQAQNFGVKAHLAITKGCNNHCSFCVVPFTRGVEVSREPEHIIVEAKRLVSTGTKEICLLGQNVNSYKANGTDFVELLRRLDKLENLKRLRFISPHPKDFHAELADAFVTLPSLCEQMHLPLQSGSDRILRRMRRWYSMETFYEKVDLLRDRLPDATLSTDLIVGFPGETEEEFEMTMEAVKNVRFDLIYSFKYSPRPGTRAAEYPEQLSEKVKAERLKVLLETQEKIIREKNEALVGTIQEVLIEGNHQRKENSVTGRTRGNHSVSIKNCGEKAGELLAVRITGANPSSLAAEPFAASPFSG